MFTYSGNCVVPFPSRRENKEHCLFDSTSVTFPTQDNILTSLHVFVFVLIVQQEIVFIYDAVFFSLHNCVCICVLRKYWSFSWVTWCIFYSDIFPQISQYFLLYKKTVLSGFAIAHPGQRRVSQLVNPIKTNGRLLYSETQFVPRSKHLAARL
jgi:hypothetical protein